MLERVWNKLVCNSRALAIAGIDRDTPDPGGELYAGTFARDADGHPTGLFTDRAKELIRRHVPEPDEAGLEAAIAAACAEYNRLGLTAVAEPGLFPHEVRAFHRTRRAGRLSVRVDMLLAGWGWSTSAFEEGLGERLAAVGVGSGFGDELLRIGGVKLLPDGGIGDRTARIREPYLGGGNGARVVDPGALPAIVRACTDLDLAIDSHAATRRGRSSSRRTPRPRRHRRARTCATASTTPTSRPSGRSR